MQGYATIGLGAFMLAVLQMSTGILAANRFKSSWKDQSSVSHEATAGSVWQGLCCAKESAPTKDEGGAQGEQPVVSMRCYGSEQCPVAFCSSLVQSSGQKTQGHGSAVGLCHDLRCAIRHGYVQEAAASLVHPCRGSNAVLPTFQFHGPMASFTA